MGTTEITEKTNPPSGYRAIIHCDGSCPANPGVMGIGFTIDGQFSTNNAQFLISYGYRLGPGTNNVAEYLGLIASLREALRQGVTHADVFADSLLMVNQVNGAWKCKDGRLKVLLAEAQGLKNLFSRLILSHIPREENHIADGLSKNPTDPSLPPPEVEIDITTGRHRTLTRRQAAMIRYWWKTRRCQNEYRLARIFGGTESALGKIGRGETYKDITEADLPGHHYRGHLVAHTHDLSQALPDIVTV